MQILGRLGMPCFDCLTRHISFQVYKVKKVDESNIMRQIYMYELFTVP